MKGAWRRAGVVTATLAGLLALLVLAAWLALPAWIETRLAPELARRYGIGPVALDIRRIGASGLDLADIGIGDAVTADHLTADYRPVDLLHRRVARIVISGLTVHAAWDGRRLCIEGIEPPAADGRQTASGTRLPDAWVGRLEIHGGVLHMAWGPRRIQIPFSLVAVCPERDLSRVNARLVLFPNDRPIRLMLHADAPGNTLTAVLQAEAAPLDRLDILPAREKLRLAGGVSAHAEARAVLFPFKIQSLSGRATSTNLRLDAPGVRLAVIGSPPLRLSWTLTASSGLAFNGSGAMQLAQPVAAAMGNLRFSGVLNPDGLEIEAGADLRPGPPWKGALRISHLKGSGRLDTGTGPEGKLTLEANGRIGGPLPLDLDTLRIEASGGGGNIAATGEFAAATGTTLSAGGLALSPAGLQGTFSARMEHPSRWQAALKAAATAPAVALTAGSQELQFGRPAIGIDVSGEDGALTFAARLTSGQGRMSPAGARISWPGIEAEVEGTLDRRDLTAGGDLRFAVRLPQVTAVNDQMEAELRPIRLDGRFRPGRQPAVSADLRAGGQIAWPAGPLTVERIALHLPLQWPPAKPPVGSLALKLIPRSGLHPGRIRTTLRQRDRGLTFDGVLQDLFFRGTRLQLSAAADSTPSGFSGRFEADLPSWSPTNPVDLGILTPAAAGITVDGKLTLHAGLVLEAGHLRSRGLIQLRGGTLNAPARNIHADGIQADLSLVDLPALRSAPGQVLRFARADLGGIRLDDGVAAFQIETPDQVLLEKGSFGWCGNRVHAGAMRFSPTMDDYDATLFCDRLKLAELLDQLGGLTAEGGGTVSGRIPVHYRRGQVTFNDGFLYSSPGEGGKIRLADIQRFTSAIDPQTLEAAQLALASEALKDYDYQWVKVGIDSQGEQLALRLQFDGKPAHPLPFVYRQELGRFVRVEAPDPGSRFQGIGLDINLRLPLNRILEYGDLVKDFQ